MCHFSSWSSFCRRVYTDLSVRFVLPKKISIPCLLQKPQLYNHELKTVPSSCGEVCSYCLNGKNQAKKTDCEFPEYEKLVQKKMLRFRVTLLCLILLAVNVHARCNIFWSGTAPFCRGKCPRGYTTLRRDKCGDGKCCWTGSKAYCRYCW